MSTPIPIEAVYDGRVFRPNGPVDLPPNVTVQLIVAPIEGTAARAQVSEAPLRRSIVDVLKSAPGGLAFQTAQEVDQYLRVERDSWGP